MEAHHSHHPTHKKKWTEYLLEFFMLFLAVFLGFVAENIRENVVERHKEKEYIESLIKDLKRDTASIKRYIPVIKIKTEKMDSLVHLSNADLSSPETLMTLTRLAVVYAAYYSVFRSNTATLTQLKSGNLRLVQKKNAVDSILKYDAANAILDIRNQQYFEFYNSYINTSEEVFDATIMVDTSYVKAGQILKPPPAVTSDKEKLRLYFNKLTALLIVTREYGAALEYQLTSATRLLNFLQDLYKLEK